MTHASQGQHWYARDGSPQYELMGANGKMRPATLRDARKTGLVPSVTTIIKCAAAPGLVNWMVDQAILAALTLPKIEGEEGNDYLARIKRDSKEQAKKAAERGTAIHAAIQGHYEGTPPDESFWPHVKGAVESVGDGPWVCEKSFAHPSGFGGKVDLHRSDIGHVLDFKSKEFTEDTKLDVWDEHAMQLAAYRVGLGMPKAAGSICYVSTTVPGLARTITLGSAHLDAGWEMFCGLLTYWKSKNQYWPELVKEAA